jgi:hypothetical protein
MNWPCCARLAAVFVFGCVLGCSSYKNPTVYAAQGKVTIDGKPIKGFAKIVFVSATDASKKATGIVDPSGNYNISNLPPGACKVSLLPMNPPPSSGPAPGVPPTAPVAQNAGPFAEIHPKLLDPNKSGKQVDITQTSSTLDIDFSTK